MFTRNGRYRVIWNPPFDDVSTPWEVQKRSWLVWRSTGHYFSNKEHAKNWYANLEG